MDLKVLDDLNLSVPKAHILAVTGESGVGKSTLLSLIGGLDSATAGEVNIRGQDITRLTEEKLSRFRAENIGFVFQNHFLLSEFTAYENILLPYLVRADRQTKDVNGHILELLDMVNLRERKDHKPGQLSGGECQRVALLRALVNKPQIVIADEPTGNLDEKNTRLIFELIKDLNKRFKVTFIIATHNLLVKRFSHEVQVIRQGKIFKRS
jgi:lipoprotein-releasing system ATP-binding protein